MFRKIDELQSRLEILSKVENAVDEPDQPWGFEPAPEPPGPPEPQEPQRIVNEEQPADY